MGDANGAGNEVWEQRQASVRGKKNRVARIERRIQGSLDARNIYFRIFDEGMVTVDEDSCGGEEEKNSDLFGARSS